MEIRYFAYGSNMCIQRITRRIGACGVHGTARLKGFRLGFHKQGADGSGKCNVLRTGDPRDVVHGVMFEIDARQKGSLDVYEGAGYEPLEVEVHSHTGHVSAYLYVARTEFVDHSLKPFDWYKRLVLAGARQHDLPAPYLTLLEQVEPVADHDAGRRGLHEVP